MKENKTKHAFRLKFIGLFFLINVDIQVNF